MHQDNYNSFLCNGKIAGWTELIGLINFSNTFNHIDENNLEKLLMEINHTLKDLVHR